MIDGWFVFVSATGAPPLWATWTLVLSWVTFICATVVLMSVLRATHEVMPLPARVRTLWVTFEVLLGCCALSLVGRVATLVLGSLSTEAVLSVVAATAAMVAIVRLSRVLIPAAKELGNLIVKVNGSMSLELELARLAKSIDECPMGVIHIHKDRRIIVVNTAFARMLGFDTTEELRGRDFLSIVHRDDKDRTRVAFESGYADASTDARAQFTEDVVNAHFTNRYVGADGRVVRLWWSGQYMAPNRDFTVGFCTPYAPPANTDRRD